MLTNDYDLLIQGIFLFIFFVLLKPDTKKFWLEIYKQKSTVTPSKVITSATTSSTVVHVNSALTGTFTA